MATIKEILAAKAAKDAEKPQDSSGLNDNIIFSNALKRAGASQEEIEDSLFLVSYEDRENQLRNFLERQKKMIKYIYIVATIIVFVLGFLYLQKMDYEDDMIEQRIYCERVAGGFWGDYKGNYEDACK